MNKIVLKLLISAAFIVPQTAFAQQPTSVESILDAAIANGDDAAIDAISKYDKSPATVKKVQAYKTSVAAKKAAEEAKKREGGFLSNWQGSGELGAFQSGGNTTSVGITAGAALTKEGNHWRYKFRALADYQRTNGITNREQAVVALEPNYKFNDRLYAFGLAQYERDRFQGFSSRYTASGGLGYQVIKSERMQLDVKAGPAWRKTNFVRGGSKSNIAGLAAVNYALKISPTITFTEDAAAYIQSGNSSFNAVTALNAKLSDKMSARISYQIDHETDPPIGLKKTDTLSRITLIFGF